MRLWSDSTGAGPAVALTHGWGASADMWRPQVAALSGAYQLLVWDLPGHGRSDSPDDPAAYTHDAAVSGARPPEICASRAP